MKTIAESNYGDAITVDMHRWYAVLREGNTVLGVIGVCASDGVAWFDSVEDWEENQ